MALFLFVFLGLFTPGPNVILLIASGARFGIAATIPHIAGVVLGVGVIAALAALGLAQLILAAPFLRGAIQIGAAGVILWLAWRLWCRRHLSPTTDTEHPFTFVQALLFQAINPKIWALAFAANGFSPVSGTLNDGLALGLLFSVTNFAVCTFWTLAGTYLAQDLRSPQGWWIFCALMSQYLALTSILLFI